MVSTNIYRTNFILGESDLVLARKSPNMSQPDESLNISFTDKVRTFLEESRNPNPKFVISLEYTQVEAGGGCLCAGGPPPMSIPRCKIELVESFVPGRGFITVPTKEGFTVFIAKPLYDIAVKTKSAIKVDVQGLIKKAITVEGIDLSSLPGGNQKPPSFMR